ncbi:sulfite exporter TauE/SafE family protein [Thalassotalea piscium]
MKTLTSVNPLTSAKFIVSFIVIWLIVIALVPISLVALFDYVLFSLLGMLGALFANATGAGGGVVFIPMFNELNFSESQSIATSFAIQCFGMTAGAITWCHHYHIEKRDLHLWQGFKRIILVSSLAAVVGIWLVYGANIQSPSSLQQNFSWFSLLLGLFIVATVFLAGSHRKHSQLLWYDWMLLILISVFGGAITAWLSVGVGELVAVYLILRRFDVNMAVAIAVVVSAITVWSAIWQHIVIDFQVNWQVVIFAGPGAIVGGIFAKTLVTYLSASRLKLFFAFWLLIIGGVGIEI